MEPEYFAKISPSTRDKIKNSILRTIEGYDAYPSTISMENVMEEACVNMGKSFIKRYVTIGGRNISIPKYLYKENYTDYIYTKVPLSKLKDWVGQINNIEQRESRKKSEWGSSMYTYEVRPSPKAYHNISGDIDNANLGEMGEILKKYFEQTKPYQQPKTEKKEMENSKTLYNVTGTEKYGNIIGYNSAGQAVLELRGSGVIETIEVTKLEEVAPYTVAIRFMNGSNSNEYHYFAKAGDVEVGDLVASPDYTSVMRVTRLATKSKLANKWLHGSVVRPTKVIERPKED